MPRTPGALNVATLVKRGLIDPNDPRAKKAVARGVDIGTGITSTPAVDKRTDKEILATIEERFEIFDNMVIGAGEDTVTSFVVTGAAGIGKSYTAEERLKQMKAKHGIRYKIIKGAISAIGLFEQAYNFRNPKDVIVLDDADRIFDDEEGLNILKSLLDTSLERTVSWYTDNPLFKQAGGPEREFRYQGSMIFLTNKNFQTWVDAGQGRYVEHMLAIMSRSIYLDLKMHSRREVGIWVKHLVTKHQILQSKEIGCSATQERQAVEWILGHRDDLREMSIRTAMKLGRIMKIYQGKDWEKVARITLLR